MNRFWRFMLVFLTSSIIVGLLLRVPNIFGIIWWPLQVGWTYVVTAIFSHIWTFIILAVVIAFLLGFPLTGWIIRAIWKGAKGTVTWGWGRRARVSSLLRAANLARGELLKRINASIGSAKYMRRTAEGREPQFFRENRMLFHALANYTTRSEITYRYWAVVKAGAAIWDQLVKDEEYGEFLTYDRDDLRKEIIAYRSGGRDRDDKEVKGWNKINLEVIDLVNRYLDLLTRMQVTSEFDLKIDRTNFTAETAEATELQNDAARLAAEIPRIYGVYNQRLRAYGAHYVLKAYKDIVLNMSNVTGDVLEHPQRFARIGAEYFMGDQTGKPNMAGVTAEGMPADEVNQFGEVINDIVEQKDDFGDLPFDPRRYKMPRKLKNPNDIIDYKSFIHLMDNIGKDWKGLSEDIRYGYHHPHSRTWHDYIAALKKGKYYEWADNEISQTQSPDITYWGIDMRALADPGKNRYWGRKHFYGETMPQGPDTIPPVNPLPVFSSLGLKKYLIEASIIDITERDKVIEFLNKYHADSASPEKELPHKPIGVMLGEEVAKAGGEN